MDASNTTVLVTGGSGYVGTWTVAGLLERGYRVRTTIRSFDREAVVRAAVGRHTSADDRLSFIVADLLRDQGWDRAVDGVSFVLHVASPMPIREYRKTDLVRPAREGTIRILKAADAANVSRVVMMSSVQAALPPGDHDAASTEESRWTDLSRKDVTDYMRSKTLAERDAWDFIRDAGGRMDLTTVLPVTILGPVLQSAVSGRRKCSSDYSKERFRLFRGSASRSWMCVTWSTFKCERCSRLKLQGNASSPRATSSGCAR